MYDTYKIYEKGVPLGQNIIMKMYKSASELIGNTPLLEISRYSEKAMVNAKIAVKLECFNPTGSAKDRAALFMLDDAEKSGRLTAGGTVIEPTSGNTGIGLAAVAASRGYRVILTMPDTMSVERMKLLSAYGAELVLTEGSRGMSGAIEKAEALAKEIPGSIIAGQFENPANPKAHYYTTGPEIWEDTDGKVDIFVAGIGTGGTLTGVGRYLKEKNPKIQIVGVEPASSPLITEGTSGSHGLMGIGANFIPDNYDSTVCDKVITVTEHEAYTAARAIAKCEGVLVGITSGAALHAATLLARLPENRGKLIVPLLPDTGERYLSTPLFSE